MQSQDTNPTPPSTPPCAWHEHGAFGPYPYIVMCGGHYSVHPKIGHVYTPAPLCVKCAVRS